MQADMEKLLGSSCGHKKRSAKAKDYRAVLSHYRFQVKRLRSDHQVP